MAVQVKSLTTPNTMVAGNPPATDSLPLPSPDSFNIIPALTPTTIYDLYVAPKGTVNRAAIIKSVRLINTSAGLVKVTLYFNRPVFDLNGTPTQSRRRYLTPLDMSLPPNYVYVDESEITLEPGDRIQGKADTANAIQFVISGVERDV